MFLNWECPAMRSLSGFVRDVIGWKARRHRPLELFFLNIPKSP